METATAKKRARDQARIERIIRETGVHPRTARHREQRQTAIDRYGGACSICGERLLPLLTIDHIKDDGSAHRVSLAGKNIAAWLAENEYPPGFQVLCWNHNILKHRPPVCDSPRATRERQRRIRLKEEALAVYGKKCACCSEDAFELLTIDHPNQDGADQRRDGVGLGHKFYTWLKKTKYPSGYVVLCFNCNSGRQFNGGVCPHTVRTNISC